MLLVFSNFSLNAQFLKIADKIFVAGYILEENNKEPIPYVNIFVKQTRRGTISDTSGYFLLKTQLNDTLVFSALGFDKKYVVINEEAIENDKALIIFLDTKIYQLKTIDIYALRRYKQLEYEISTLKLPENDFTNASKNFPFRPKDIDYYKLNSAPLSGLGVVISPITALYEMFSKEGKERQKLQELEKQDYIESIIEKKIGINAIMKIIDEDMQNTYMFLAWCNFSADFINNISSYDLAFVIKHKHKQYKTTKRT